MLIQCNILDDVEKENSPSPYAVQTGDDSQKVSLDNDLGASKFMLLSTRLYVWRWIKMGARWRHASTASLFKRSVFAIFIGVTLCFLVGGLCLLGLLYFDRVDAAESNTASNAVPRVQDVRAMHHEQYGVMVMTRFLQQQAYRRQSITNWWQMLAESSVLLHTIEWQGNTIEFIVSGRFSAINELMIKARSLTGSTNTVLREFRPDSAHHQRDSITGVAQLKMTLCDVSRPAVLPSSEAYSVVEGPMALPLNEISPLLKAYSPNEDCAPIEVVQVDEALLTHNVPMDKRSKNTAFINEKGEVVSPLDEASVNQKELFVEGSLHD